MPSKAITCRYGLPGHEREYVVIIDGFDHKTFIPKSISDELKKAFPETTVLNRGTRIEVITPDTDLGERIITNIKETLFERPWIGDM